MDTKDKIGGSYPAISTLDGPQRNIGERLNHFLIKKGGRLRAQTLPNHNQHQVKKWRTPSTEIFRGDTCLRIINGVDATQIRYRNIIKLELELQYKM